MWKVIRRGFYRKEPCPECKRSSFGWPRPSISVFGSASPYESGLVELCFPTGIENYLTIVLGVTGRNRIIENGKGNKTKGPGQNIPSSPTARLPARWKFTVNTVLQCLKRLGDPTPLAEEQSLTSRYNTEPSMLSSVERKMEYQAVE